MADELEQQPQPATPCKHTVWAHEHIVRPGYPDQWGKCTASDCPCDGFKECGK